MAKISCQSSFLFIILSLANFSAIVLSQRYQQEENPQICKRFLKHVDNFNHNTPVILIMNQEGLFAHWRLQLISGRHTQIEL